MVVVVVVGGGGLQSFSCQTQLLLCYVELSCGCVGVVTTIVVKFLHTQALRACIHTFFVK